MLYSVGWPASQQPRGAQARIDVGATGCHSHLRPPPVGVASGKGIPCTGYSDRSTVSLSRPTCTSLPPTPDRSQPNNTPLKTPRATIAPAEPLRPIRAIRSLYFARGSPAKISPAPLLYPYGHALAHWVHGSKIEGKSLAQNARPCRAWSYSAASCLGCSGRQRRRGLRAAPVSSSRRRGVSRGAA